MQTDLERSIEFTHSAAQSVGHHAAPIRFGFVANEESDSLDRVPPLARLLRGGRSGDVPIKLELTMLWLASTRAPHQTKNLAHAWATLLELSAPTTNGARRIKAALARLVNEGLIRRELRAGTSSVVTIFNERGDGSPYRHPAKSQRYLQLPTTFWTNRWIHSMPGTAIAVFLAILLELWDRHKVFCWVSPSEAKKRYAFSADTWTRGVKYLSDKNLIVVTRLPVSRNEFEEPGRYRNAYRLKADAANKAEYHPDWSDVLSSLEGTLA